MCGKDTVRCPYSNHCRGSPPHVRERPFRQQHGVTEDGITPACAGKTGYHTLVIDTAEDHPRMCGKDMLQKQRQPSTTGSPPHVRERRNIETHKDAYYRITPACAGKTGSVRHTGGERRDHPRMCGKDLYRT